MAHKVVYQVSGESYSDLDYVKSMGFIDCAINGHGQDHLDQNFVNQCKARGMTPIYFGGNDGVSTCGGANVGCYVNLSNMGFQVAGGESTSADEMRAAQQAITFLNAGGEGIVPNQDSFGNLGFSVVPGGHGVISFIESYNYPATLVPGDCLAAMYHANNSGCMEVGIMIGAWMPLDASPYLSMAATYEANGYTFGGFHLWWGIGTDMAQTVRKWSGVIQTLQATWPPDMRDWLTRKVGGKGGGGGTVTPIRPKPIGAWDLVLND